MIIFALTLFIHFSTLIGIQIPVRDDLISDQYYDSLDYTYKVCPSKITDGKICYSERPESIYGFKNLSYNISQVQSCTDGLLTELDENGNWLGTLICAATQDNINKETYNDDSLLKFRQVTSQIHILSREFRRGSQTIPNTISFPQELQNLDPYYFASCLYGYDKSCNFIANLCVLSLYDENTCYCKFLKDNINNL